MLIETPVKVLTIKIMKIKLIAGAMVEMIAIKIMLIRTLPTVIIVLETTK